MNTLRKDHQQTDKLIIEQREVTEPESCMQSAENICRRMYRLHATKLLNVTSVYGSVERSAEFKVGDSITNPSTQRM